LKDTPPKISHEVATNCKRKKKKFFMMNEIFDVFSTCSTILS